MNKGLSPTQRTLKAIRDKGGVAAIVEKFNAFVGEHGIRQDMFGIIDVLWCDSVDTIGVQCCASDFKAHVNKLTIDNAQASVDWLSSPYRKLQVWGWRKIKAKRGGKAMIWQPRVLDITIDMIGKGTEEEE